MKNVLLSIVVFVSITSQATTLVCKTSVFDLHSMEEVSKKEFRGRPESVLSLGTVNGFKIEGLFLMGQVLITAKRSKTVISSVVVEGTANLRFQDQNQVAEAFCNAE